MLERVVYYTGGEGGIRTHVGLHPNGFQDRPVMTASVPLHVKYLFADKKDYITGQKGIATPFATFLKNYFAAIFSTPPI